MRKGFAGMALVLMAVVISSAVGCNKKGYIRVTDGDRAKLTGKTLALFPTREKVTLTPETVAMLTAACNATMNAKFPQLLSNAKIIANDDTLEKLSANAAMLDTMTKLFEQYDKTQIYLKSNVKALADHMKADYLILPKLSSEKLDVIFASSGTMSLDVTILDKTGNVFFQGVGEYKRWGMFGGGQINNKNAAIIAEEMFNMAMQSLS